MAFGAWLFENYTVQCLLKLFVVYRMCIGWAYTLSSALDSL